MYCSALYYLTGYLLTKEKSFRNKPDHSLLEHKIKPTLLKLISDISSLSPVCPSCFQEGLYIKLHFEVPLQRHKLWQPAYYRSKEYKHLRDLKNSSAL